MSPRRVSLLALVAYALLAVAATHPLWLNLTTALPSDIGDPLLNTWILAWDGHALLTGPAGLFDANIFYPLPNTLAYSEHLLSSAALTLPVLLAGNEPVLAYNLSFLLSFALGGWGAFLLIHRHTRHAWAAFLAGLVFAFAPYRFAAFSHLQLLTLQWLPFCLILVDALLKPSAVRALALIALLWMQLASSWHLAVFTIVIVAIYLLGRLLVARPLRIRSVLEPLVAILVAAALTWPLVTPYVASLGELRRSRPIEMAAEFGAHLSDYLAAPPANRLFAPLTAPLAARPFFTEENFVFPGVIAPALAIVGLLLARRRRRERARTLVWALLLALTLALTWGPVLLVGGLRISLPYAWLAGLSSVFGLIRVPPRWMIAALLPLAALAGLGAAGVLGRGRRAAPLALALAAGLLLESCSVPLPLAQVESLAQLPPVYHWLAAQSGDFGVLEWPIHVAPRPEYPETRRLYGSTLHWKRLVNGYSGLTPARQSRLDAALRGFPGDGALQALRDLARQGVRYLIVHSGEQGFDRDRWQYADRWILERSPTTLPVFEAQGDHVYELVAPGTGPLDGQGGVQVPPTTWNNGLTLVAGAVPLDRSRVDLYWRAGAVPARDATVFVHLLDAAGNVLAQGDGVPVAGHYPLTAWQQGEIVRDRHVLVPSSDAAAANGVQLRIGLYYPESLQRVPTATGGADHVLLDLAAQGAR